MKVKIVFYSMYGHIYWMVETVTEGTHAIREDM
jgi:hypothetical protein